MNNDISRDLNSFIKTTQRQKQNNARIPADMPIQNSEKILPDKSKSLEDSMGFLGVLGSMQVKRDLSKSVNNAVEEFIEDPEKIKEKVDFCDELVARGYCLEDADKKTCEVFHVLEDPNTYL